MIRTKHSSCGKDSDRLRGNYWKGESALGLRCLAKHRVYSLNKIKEVFSRRRERETMEAGGTLGWGGADRARNGVGGGAEQGANSWGQCCSEPPRAGRWARCVWCGQLGLRVQCTLILCFHLAVTGKGEGVIGEGGGWGGWVPEKVGPRSVKWRPNLVKRLARHPLLGKGRAQSCSRASCCYSKPGTGPSGRLRCQ